MVKIEMFEGKRNDF